MRDLILISTSAIQSTCTVIGRTVEREDKKEIARGHCLPLPKRLGSTVLLGCKEK